MARYWYTTKVYNNATIYYRFIETTVNNIRLKRIDSSIANTTYCGVNANFFYSESQDPNYMFKDYEAEDIYTIGIDRGASVKDHGLINLLSYTKTGKRGTFYILNSGTKNVMSIETFSDLGIDVSQVSFAVGGMNLNFEMKTATQTRLETLWRAEENDLHKHKKNKTAIFFLSSVNSYGYDIVLCTMNSDGTANPPSSYSMPSPYEFRQHIMEIYPTVARGIMLDGGGSTGMAYKNTLTRQTCLTDGGRDIPTMITVDM